MNDQQATKILSATLEGFDDSFDLLKREGVVRVSDIFHPVDSTERPRTIYRDNLDYLGKSIQLIVFRYKKRPSDPRDKTQFALFNDTTGLIQPVSIQQILRVFKMPPDGQKFETNLENVLIVAKDAQKRIEVKLNNRQ